MKTIDQSLSLTHDLLEIMVVRYVEADTNMSKVSWPVSMWVWWQGSKYNPQSVPNVICSTLRQTLKEQL